MIRRGGGVPTAAAPFFESFKIDGDFMPYKSGLIQAALGAFGALAFVISQWSGKPEGKRQACGVVEKIEERRIRIKEQNGKRSEFELSSESAIYLNDKKISLAELPVGRTAMVQFETRQRQNVAMLVDVFPTHEDTDAARPGEAGA